MLLDANLALVLTFLLVGQSPEGILSTEEEQVVDNRPLLHLSRCPDCDDSQNEAQKPMSRQIRTLKTGTEKRPMLQLSKCPEPPCGAAKPPKPFLPAVPSGKQEYRKEWWTVDQEKFVAPYYNPENYTGSLEDFKRLVEGLNADFQSKMREVEQERVQWGLDLQSVNRKVERNAEALDKISSTEMIKICLIAVCLLSALALIVTLALCLTMFKRMANGSKVRKNVSTEKLLINEM